MVSAVHGKVSVNSPGVHERPSQKNKQPISEFFLQIPIFPQLNLKRADFTRRPNRPIQNHFYETEIKHRGSIFTNKLEVEIRRISGRH